ncbi:MAG: alpha/beta hydrolase [Aquificae bacterium]|nr:alpha/beta hydrolase [Aquificota bacterium]
MLKNPILIHGWGFSSEVFEGFRGIKYDLPGHGKNKTPYENLAQIIKQLSELAKQKHDILGWSLGASVAVLFALKYPHRVNRLFLIGATPHFGKAWEEKNIRAMKLLIKKKGINAFRRLAHKETDAYFDPESGMKLLEDFINLKLYDALTGVKKETYIIHGVLDPITPPAEAFKLRQLLKNPKLILLGGGHLPVKNEEHLRQAILKSGKNL